MRLAGACSAWSTRPVLRGRLRGQLVDPHRRSCRLPRVPAVQQAPPHRHGVLQRRTSASSRRAASCRRWTSRRDDPTFGVKTIQDLGWKDLLDGFTCTECGRCQDACPAWATGKPLNPKTMIMGLREMSGRRRARACNLIPNVRRSCARPYGRRRHGSRPRRLAAPIVDDGHPVRRGLGLRHLRRLRRGLPGAHRARRQDRRAAAQPRARGVALPDRADRRVHGTWSRHGNPWGLPQATRLDWTKGLPFEVPDGGAALAAGGPSSDEIECLYWVGCAAAFDERNRRVARAFVTCLDAAGVRFAILGQEESCTGDPARRMGNEYVYQMLAKGNVETLNRYGLRSIVTACPHCFNTIGNEYGQFGGQYEVVHHSVYLQRLLGVGRLTTAMVEGGGARSVTLPRLVLPDALQRGDRPAAGRAGRRARPRAARDGQPRPPDASAAARAAAGCGWKRRAGTRINSERTRQALETGASTVATACPYCMTMLKDGLAGAESNTDGVTTADIAELLAESLAPARAGRGGSCRSSSRAGPTGRNRVASLGSEFGRRPGSAWTGFGRRRCVTDMGVASSLPAFTPPVSTRPLETGDRPARSSLLARSIRQGRSLAVQASPWSMERAVTLGSAVPHSRSASRNAADTGGSDIGDG